MLSVPLGVFFCSDNPVLSGSTSSTETKDTVSVTEEKLENHGTDPENVKTLEKEKCKKSKKGGVHAGKDKEEKQEDKKTKEREMTESQPRKRTESKSSTPEEGFKNNCVNVEKTKPEKESKNVLGKEKKRIIQKNGKKEKAEIVEKVEKVEIVEKVEKDEKGEKGRFERQDQVENDDVKTVEQKIQVRL